MAPHIIVGRVLTTSEVCMSIFPSKLFFLILAKVEANPPPIRKIYVIGMLSLEEYPNPIISRRFTKAPPPIPAD
jgi:hypothetical protein